jgi:lipopolysaccharide export system permease protein
VAVIWQRYLFKEAIKVFFLFIFSFCFIYILIDYSANLFRLGNFSLIHIVQYYVSQIIIEANILIPAALLLGTIKVLCSANQRRELIALMAGGISIKRVVGPFLFLGCICTALLFINTQFFIPLSKQILQEMTGTSQHKRLSRSSAVNVIYLNDNSKMIYQDFDAHKNVYFDLYWIRSSDDLYHMKHLLSSASPPQGLFVDHIERDPFGYLTKTESFSEMNFPQLHLSANDLREKNTPLINLSLSQLLGKLSWGELISQNELATVFLFKILMPFLCLLAVLIPAPYCMRYDRNLPVFFLYAVGIFSFIAFYTLMQSVYILSISRYSSPWILLLPFGLAAGYASWKYKTL